jgi:leukotriene-A4 hydrolase
MAVDPSSFANVADVRVAHLHLQLNADFNAHTLSGQAELTLEGLSDAGVTRVVLDTKRLSIASICDAEGQPVTYAYADAAEDDVFGRALNIDLAQSLSKGVQTKIVVTYSTSAEASAIQWLPPAQTSGKVHPYLFTQCQAIHCRSLAPVQDSPHNKFTYTAQLTVPAPLVALMSAHRQPELTQLNGDSITYHFKQPVCMPSYLLAFAIGALESRPIGPRSAVWSEKETVEAGAHEFAETEAFLTAAEDVCGPYVWGNYDVLLLPPSFPYGGTFLSPFSEFFAKIYDWFL